ncbi:tetratricopeptide repeat protein [Metallosphaera tengchongensis]|uniref:Tetratricopeptide repeat protein n=1 Tax=Metallosphaera tengchongensis TaxID=1532350 RepID=A0A6N0NYZ3_9CREN|nr:tetratricopeptide repeat protein [Metallosphaera tengchongensis]QKR00588.1 tetratricopeptide repeat protein [Metallosphaera tengchongensis]
MGEDLLFKADEMFRRGEYLEVLDLLDGVELVEAFMMRAESMVMLGRYEDALTELERGLSIFPYSYVMLTRQAEILESMGKYEDALEKVNRALELIPFSSEHHFLRARVLFKLQRYEDANLELAEVLRTNPKNVEARIMKASSYYNMGLKLDALSEVNRALAFRKEDPKLHELKGKIYFELGYHKLALSEFKIASHYDPNNSDYYYEIASCHYYLGMYDDALIYLNEALKISRKAPYLALMAVLKKERGEDPSQEVREAVELDKSMRTVLENLLNVKISPTGYIEGVK